MPQNMQGALRAAFEGAPSVQARQAGEQVDRQEEILEDEGQDETLSDEESGDETTQSDDEGVELEYANDLPAILGIDPEQFYSLKWRLADNQDPVALGEIKDRIQQIDSERAALAQERTRIEEQQKAIQQQALQYGQGSQAVTEKMQRAMGHIAAIENSYQALQADWAQREKEDPGQVALERQRISEQYQAAQSEFQSAQQEAQQEQAKAYEGWIADQHRILTTEIPDWSIPEKRREMQDRLGRLAVDRYGATQEDLGRIDARMIRLLLDAERGIKAAEGAEKAVKKVKASPKALPKGVRLKHAQHSKQRVQDLEQKARATRTRRDVIEATRGILEESRRK